MVKQVRVIYWNIYVQKNCLLYKVYNYMHLCSYMGTCMHQCKKCALMQVHVCVIVALYVCVIMVELDTHSYFVIMLMITQQLKS